MYMGSTQVTETKPQSSFDRFLTQIPELIASGLSISNAQKLYKLNLQRLQQGMQPLDASAISNIQPGFNVGLDPATKQLLIYGGIGLGLILLVGALKK